MKAHDGRRTAHGSKLKSPKPRAGALLERWKTDILTLQPEGWSVTARWNERGEGGEDHKVVGQVLDVVYRGLDVAALQARGSKKKMVSPGAQPGVSARPMQASHVGRSYDKFAASTAWSSAMSHAARLGRR